MRVIKLAGTIDAEVDGEIVALNIDKGQCYGMNEVASRVWKILDHHQSLEDICSVLREEFEVSEEQCRTEVRHLIEQFAAEGIVKIQES